MKIISIYLVCIINLIILFRYCWLTYKKRIKPALAMWVFFSTSVSISLVTYLKEGEFSLLDNILNATDLLLVLTVTCFIYFFGDFSSKFNRFDKGCLITVMIIVCFWYVTENHFVTNILVQMIQLIAYLPVIHRLWVSQKNSESFLMWFLLMLAPIISLFSSEGVLAFIYSGRAIFCVSVLLMLMARVEIKEKYRIKKQNKQMLFETGSVE